MIKWRHKVVHQVLRDRSKEETSISINGEFCREKKKKYFNVHRDD